MQPFTEHIHIIDRLKVSVACHMLGVHLAPNGNNTDKVKYLYPWLQMGNNICNGQ